MSVFSKWIANLGVVPLLLFSAFLLLPILVFLLSLLFLVTRVLETISPLLFQLSQLNRYLTVCTVTITDIFKSYLHVIRLKFSTWTNNSPAFVPDTAISVKVLSAIYLFGYVFSSAPIYAQSNNQEVINLAKGEIKEIIWEPLTRYTIGNKEIVSVKVIKDQKKVLIKGKHLGLSDLILWGKYNQRRQIQINIIDKRAHQKIYLLASRIKQLGLKVNVLDKTLFLSGGITSFEQYQSLLSLRNEASKNKLALHLTEVEISRSLERKVFTHFLKEIMGLNLTMLDCSPNGIAIECQELGHESLRTSREYLDQQFIIDWIPQQGARAMKQYEVQLILQQFENQTGESFSLGLNRLEGNWEKILSDSPLSLIKNNNVHIEDSEFKTSTLAQPKIIGRFGVPIQVQVGQEILYTQNLGNNLATQQWKFAGLDIDINLSPVAEGILVKFKNSLSQPSGSMITKSSQSSSIIVEEGESKILFDIGFQMKKTDQSRFPGLSSIPLFGSLFKNNFSSSSYKNVLCIIKITEI